MPNRVFVSLALVTLAAFACGGSKEGEPKAGGTERSGGLSPDQVRVTVRANGDQLMACRDRTKQKRDVAGVVQVAWTIAVDGRVQDARVVESTVRDPDVEACVVSVVERFSFPPSTAPTVISKLPFTFNATSTSVDAGAPRDGGASTRDAGATRSAPER